MYDGENFMKMIMTAFFAITMSLVASSPLKAEVQVPVCENVAVSAAAGCIGLGTKFSDGVTWCDSGNMGRFMNGEVLEVQAQNDGSNNYLVKFDDGQVTVNIVERLWSPGSKKIICDVKGISELRNP